MHKADQPYIANQQGWREWDHLVAIVDSDAVVHTEQQDASNKVPTRKKEMLRTKFTLGR
jgi:hypothetical protein